MDRLDKKVLFQRTEYHSVEHTGCFEFYYKQFEEHGP